MSARPRIVGVLNISPESHIAESVARNVDAILAKAAALHQAGANYIELGARSISEDAPQIDDATEQARLQPALQALHAQGYTLMVDTWSEATARFALDQGVDMLNFTGRAPSPALFQALADADTPTVLAFLPWTNAYAMRNAARVNYGVEQILDYFAEQQAKAATCGVRIVADPNAGIFHPALDDAEKIAYQLQAIACIAPLIQRGFPVYIYCPRKESLTSRLIMAGLIHQARPSYVRIHEPDIFCRAANAMTAKGQP